MTRRRRTRRVLLLPSSQCALWIRFMLVLLAVGSCCSSFFNCHNYLLLLMIQAHTAHPEPDEADENTWTAWWRNTARQWKEWATSTRRRAAAGVEDSSSLGLQVSADSPILILGLPRSGSLALHEFFQCNGLHSAHYCCGGGTTQKTHFPCDDDTDAPTCGSCVHDNLLHHRPPFSNCGSYEVYSQFDVETSNDPIYAWFLPQHYCLPLLHESYPDAIWILNTRETPSRWSDSVLHWYSVTQRLLASFQLPYYYELHDNNNNNNNNKDSNEILLAPTHDLTEQQLRGALERSVQRTLNDTSAHERRRGLLEQVYRNHTARVRDFVRRYPSSHHVLLEINVDDPNVGQVLAQAFAGFASDCWKWDAVALDDDWKDLSLKL